MKKRFTKFMALLMTGILCMSTATFAATTPANEYTDPTAAKGSASSNAQMEGWVDKDVFRVVLPTVDINNDTFGFIIDPQGLIAATDGKKYEGLISANAITSETGLYFKNYASGDSTLTGLSDSSDSMTAINKGTVPVDVKVSVAVEGLKTIGLSAEEADLTSGDAKKTNIYLAIAASGDGVSGNAKTAVTDKGGSATYSLEAASADAYAVSVSGDAYKYDLTEAAASADANPALFKSVSFNLTGACNKAADVDWSKLQEETPVVTVTWEIKKGGSYLASNSFTSSALSIGVSMPDGVSITSATVEKGGAQANLITLGSKYFTYSSTQITISSTVYSNYNGGTVIIKYSDGKEDTVSIE